MTQPTEPRRKLQDLLRELFQFDCADLDFGIYRIMNHKRAEIERFIERDLLDAIGQDLQQGALAGQAAAVAEMEQIAQQIRAVAAAAISPDGELDEHYRGGELGRRYEELREQAATYHARPEQESVIFNHLYNFFRFYYQDGDFIQKMRYSTKRSHYAIPYNGEEVYLHWANKDQYYVKTGEHFTDYTFKAPNGVTVHFKLQAAEVEQNNVKGEKRFFLPLVKQAAWDASSREVTIPFEYRPLTEQEQITYGAQKQQDKIITEALEAIPRRFRKDTEALQALPARFKKETDALAAFTAERRKANDGQPVSHLEHHLRQYTRRNTSDFFIHKDLRAFLERELDFYLKNEVLNVDEILAGDGAQAAASFQIARTIRAIASRIIAFLAQIEDFQKRLFEKKKFVLSTEYCMTLDRVPEALYPEIARNKAQVAEWKRLFKIDEIAPNLFHKGGKGTVDVAFLKAHLTLVLDTRFFGQDFKDRLLATFDNLEEQTGGLLIHGENFQALNLLLEKYRERVRCIHIDPPYNTETSGFLYKNDYQHSSWAAMMGDRIASSLSLMASDGAFLCHIDENEYELLHLMLEGMGVPSAGTVVWDKRNPMLGRKGVATQHEYVVWRTWADCPVYLRPGNARRILAKAQSLIRQHGAVNDDVRREFAAWVSSCEGLTGGEKAYRLLDDDGRVFQSVAMGAPERRQDPKFHIPLIHPVTGKECPVPDNGWSRAPETLQELIARNEIIFGKDETVQPRRKVFLTDESRRQLPSVIADAMRGKMDVLKLGVEFPYCHPVSLYEELLGAAARGGDDVVLDHFAGSGTTGHAVLNLNAEDGGSRKYILVEVADYFDTVLKPRIQKVMFSREWKDGKPTSNEGHSHVFKYQRLESYEDALDNISFDAPDGQQAMQFSDYLLRYMLDFETRDSETLLGVAQLESPFSYTLHIHRDGETREQPVDLPETFNYLIGLHVKTRRAYKDGDRRYLVYRGSNERSDVAVIWRDTKGWTKADFERDKKFVLKQKLTEGTTEVFVNGDSLIPGAKSLDPVFKHRMLGGS